MRPIKLLDQVTGTGAGTPASPYQEKHSVHAFGQTSAGAGSATIKIEGTNIHNPGSDDWNELAEIVLTLATTRSSLGMAIDAPWRMIRARVSAISGTGAAVSTHLVGKGS
jgi:hypothetical protein